MKLLRFEKDLFSLNIDSIENQVPNIEKKYGEFFEIFNHKIINIGGTNNIQYFDFLRKFLTDFIVLEAYEKVQNEYADFSEEESSLINAFKHYKYYFPEKNIPAVYTYISGFNQSIVIADNILGIGLDKYLGAGCEYYVKMGIPSFSRYKMTREKIVPDAMMAVAMAEFPYNDSLDNVLSQMIYNGKIMYFLDKILPETSDSIKIGYSPAQIDWCENNEKEMWTYFVENKILFKSEYMEIKRYLEDGPYTTSFPRQSPSRTGIWIGWQIVRSYMQNNQVSFQDLMNEGDYQNILNKSKYMPW